MIGSAEGIGERSTKCLVPHQLREPPSHKVAGQLHSLKQLPCGCEQGPVPTELRCCDLRPCPWRSLLCRRTRTLLPLLFKRNHSQAARADRDGDPLCLALRAASCFRTQLCRASWSIPELNSHPPLLPRTSPPFPRWR